MDKCMIPAESVIETAPNSGHEESPAPVAENSAVPFLTPGVWVLICLAATGLIMLGIRFVYGLGAVTNLDNQYPWGIWIGIDVATGVALAAGGFTTSFVAHVLHNHKFEVLVRPALLTAMLGYTFAALGVCIDLGRYYNIWHMLMPSMWQGNSALFEVGICVTLYLTVLYLEFLPIICERFMGKVSLPGFLHFLNEPLNKFLSIAHAGLNRVMTVFIIMGIVLSCAHQSSLGTLMVIAPNKLHGLWHTPVLPLQFLLSAFAVGLSMAIFESLWASRSLKREMEMRVLSPLARIIPFLLVLYLGSKVVDMANRESWRLALEPTLQAFSFWVEIIVGIVLPLIILMTHKLRRRPGVLFAAVAMVVFGVMLNRINVFVIGYKPLFGDGPYVPAIPEILVTVGLVSLIVLIYRAWIFIFPILPREGGHENV